MLCTNCEYSHANAKLIKTNKRNLHFLDLLIDSQLYAIFFLITTINHMNQLKFNSKCYFGYDKSIYIEIDGFLYNSGHELYAIWFVCGVIIRWYCIENSFDCIDSIFISVEINQSENELITLMAEKEIEIDICHVVYDRIVRVNESMR